MSSSKTRLGRNGAKEIMIHPFFRGINWKKIKQMRAPFVPDLKDEKDT